MRELTGSGKALLATLLFRMLFGGYLIGLDQFHFNDVESAYTVLVIYLLVTLFAVLFLFGKRFGAVGIIALDAVFLVLQTAFIILTLGQIADVGLHDPLNNWLAAILMYLFSLLTLLFAIRIYREK